MMNYLLRERNIRVQEGDLLHKVLCAKTKKQAMVDQEERAEYMAKQAIRWKVGFFVYMPQGYSGWDLQLLCPQIMAQACSVGICFFM